MLLLQPLVARGAEVELLVREAHPCGSWFAHAKDPMAAAVHALVFRLHRLDLVWATRCGVPCRIGTKSGLIFVMGVTVAVSMALRCCMGMALGVFGDMRRFISR